MNKYSQFNSRPQSQHSRAQSRSKLPIRNMQNGSDISPKNRLSNSFSVNRINHNRSSIALEENSLNHTMSFAQLNTSQLYKTYELKIASPANSNYDLSYIAPARPKSSYISSYSQIENERQVKLKGSLIDLNRKRVFKKVTPINLSNKLPTKLQFEEILRSLNAVTKNINQGQKKLVLSEGQDIFVELPEGKYQYFRINITQKPCPVTIKLYKKRGDITTYTSKKTSEPNHLLHDEKFRSGTIVISEKSFYFKSNMLYLGIYGERASRFLISIRFGTKNWKANLGTSASLKAIK